MATPQTPAPPAALPLEQLNAMVNAVLIQTGKIFKDPKLASSAKSAYNLKRIIPATIDRFQNSLDELEDEIHRAQTVFRRDLAIIRADRIQREQAEAAERQRVAAEATDRASEPAEAQSKPDDIMRGVEDLLNEPNPPAVKEKTPEAPPQPEPAANPQPPPPSSVAPASAPAPTAPMSHPAPINTDSAPARDPLFDATPTTANMQDTEYDFDSLFENEATGPTDQPVDTTAQNHAVSDFDLDLGVGDDSSHPLLRGLEDFANSGADNTNTSNIGSTSNDFSMLDLPNVPAAGAPNSGALGVLAGVGDLTSGAPQQQSVPAQESQATDDIMDLDVEATNFDDLFQWEDNQEGTQFEDQFLDFGN
ncbi:uncharacterized protein BDZ99DRAFT_564752 [Mytilinidion resinicola]|uniref:Uncharacterized protein n=1 Tax=Mytilinidion resinicola TaxID=574789 RepID=A0A6A6Z750_9PEZI|nr:uncharacterized protein BDZ99DRAFT_564752 [Mytilinidion resinicola]KAF2816931.1 hypothetical protein BDZ99DRAFT_564752 [Mytilinidion resinicola]